MVAVSRRTQAAAAAGGMAVKPIQFFILITLCTLSFYTGKTFQTTTTTASSSSSESSSSYSSVVQQSSKSLSMEECHQIKNQAIETIKRQNQIQREKDLDNIEHTVRERVHELLMVHQGQASHKDDEEEEEEEEEEARHGGVRDSHSNTSKSTFPRFMKSHSAIANGIARVSKDEFTSTYDYGPPMDKENTNQGIGQDVLILYNKLESIPTSNTDHTMSIQKYNIDEQDSIPLLSANEATENCDTMNVVTVGNPGNTRQCTALVYNYENYHVQRWMRVNLDRKGKLDKSQPLRSVSRGHSDNGARHFISPDTNSITKHWKTLYTYLDTLDSVLEELKPVAESVAIDNTIIVMTCNLGQSELLMNFVCNAKAKGLDVGNVLVFPTDRETKELAEGLGLKTFYDEKNFEDMPAEEAQHYGDKNFIAMMFAKVVCVQLINHLGYDLLFQDVDMVWYKNPLDYFHDDTNPYHDFDMYFQDDGAHSSRYAPYSANSGFYYVRNNQRTRYLFAALLYSGDIILQSHSHQQALVQLMTEHASLFGLKVKVLSRDMEEFPGGWHYHRTNKDFMKKVVQEEITPYIFHMSWTKNKDNKIKFLEQMGQWYVRDVCIAQTKSHIIANSKEGEGGGEHGDEQMSVGEHGDSNDLMLFEPCCLAEPNIVCHYRDKPSKIPCRDKDPIDAGRPSFW